MVPQFASSTSSSSSIDSELPRHEDNDILVDGFVVGKPNRNDYNTIDKDSKPSRPDEKDKTNRSLPPKDSQGTTRGREVGAILIASTTTPEENDVQIAGVPGPQVSKTKGSLKIDILG